tara:strand:- start:2396 stop:3040 length:645 start_codon:yes stop_codon:yes gene_type:complete
MKKSITIPSEVGEITLEQYQALLKIDEPSDEQLVSILCKITPQQVLEIPSKVYSRAIESLSNVISQISDEQKHVLRFRHNGIEYGMIPNLDDISYGENKDLIGYLQDWKTMHLAMSVLYRPVVNTASKTYSIEKYNGTKEHRDIMAKMPLDIVLGAQSFFSALTRDLLKAIPNYLSRVVEQQMEQTHSQTTKENGEAMMNCIISLKETLDGLMR